jgi:hypothetical protein
VKPGEDGEWKLELDRALERLLVGEVTVKVDPTTGQVISTSEGEKSSLTDPEDAPTIP